MDYEDTLTMIDNMIKEKDLNVGILTANSTTSGWKTNKIDTHNFISLIESRKMEYQKDWFQYRKIRMYIQNRLVDDGWEFFGSFPDDYNNYANILYKLKDVS